MGVTKGTTNGNGRGTAKKREASTNISAQHHCKIVKIHIIPFQADCLRGKK